MIVFNSTMIDLTEHKIQSNSYELVAASGKQRKSGRPVYIFGVYVPPRMMADSFQDLMECVINEIGKIKSSHSDAIIIVGGDMNRRNFDTLTDAYNDICLLYTSPSPRDRQKSRMPSSA